MNLKNLFIFMGGVVCGAIAASTLLASKIKNIRKEADLEIDSMREYYLRKKESEVANEENDPGREERSEYEDKIRDNGYYDASYDSVSVESNKIEMNPLSIIDRETFKRGLDYYDQRDLSYYPNGYLTDAYGNIIKDQISLLGSEAVKILQEGKVNELYVRNKLYEEDYSIFVEDDPLELEKGSDGY